MERSKAKPVQRPTGTSPPINHLVVGLDLNRQRECGCFMLSRRNPRRRPGQRSFTASRRRSTFPHQPMHTATILSGIRTIRTTVTATSMARVLDSDLDSGFVHPSSYTGPCSGYRYISAYPSWRVCQSRLLTPGSDIDV